TPSWASTTSPRSRPPPSGSRRSGSSSAATIGPANSPPPLSCSAPPSEPPCRCATATASPRLNWPRMSSSSGQRRCGRSSAGRPVLVGRRRVPGLKLEDDRVIRLLEGLLHPGTFVADWTTRDVHERLLARHRLTDDGYRLGQLRYDLGKLRAHGLVERIGASR